MCGLGENIMKTLQLDWSYQQERPSTFTPQTTRLNEKT